MRQVEIDRDTLAQFCESSAAMLMAVRAAQDADVGQAVDNVLATGEADVEMTISVLAGQFTATLIMPGGARVVVMEAMIGRGKLDS